VDHQRTGLLAAVLFDMDGLLVDSEPQWFAAESRTFALLGGAWTKGQQIDLLGSNLAFAADYMIEHSGSDRSTAEVMRLLQDHMSEELDQKVSFRPGALGLIDLLSQSAVPLALVTSSVRVHVDAVMRHVGGNPFRCIVTADDVTRLKPHPDPYLAALAALGVPASRTVVLEDSPAGVTSAEAAGCRVVAVPSVVPIATAPGRAVLESLTEVDLVTLERLVTRW
jgi:HAD superfamily hydrolase (TIGR01509 family)